MLRLAINFTGVNEGTSIMHFTPAEDDLTAAQAAADAVDDFIVSFLGFVSNAQLAQVDTEVLVVNESTGQTTGVLPVTSEARTGTDAANALPNATMALFRWRTGVFFAGREIRGRTFWPGLTETSNSATGNFSGAADLTADATAFIAASDLAIYSPTRGIATNVTVGTCWDEFAVLRSRRD